MKRYIIKPDSIDLFGPEANVYTVIDEDMVETIAHDWEKPVDEVLEHLIEDDSDKHAYRLLYRFPGNRPSREKLNELIRYEDGSEEDFFENDEAFKQAIKEGFVKWDWYYTTIWIDD